MYIFCLSIHLNLDVFLIKIFKYFANDKKKLKKWLWDFENDVNCSDLQTPICVLGGSFEEVHRRQLSSDCEQEATQRPRSNQQQTQPGQLPDAGQPGLCWTSGKFDLQLRRELPYTMITSRRMNLQPGYGQWEYQPDGPQKCDNTKISSE